MFPSNTLLSLILITLTAVDASLVSRSTSGTTLSFAKKINERGTLTIAEKDRARVQTVRLSKLGKRSTTSFGIQDNGVAYTTQVGVGNPATDYTLLLDTGSANTWIGAAKPYVKTDTSKDTGDYFKVEYGTANVTGEEWIDTVTLAPGLVITEQSIGVANWSIGIDDVDGLLGLGPSLLTFETVSGVQTIPTVSDNLLSQGAIQEEVLGIYFVPNAEKDNNGELTFGSYDDSVTTTPVLYVPLTNTTPAAYYWGINQTVSYGDTTILSSTSGIVDTGTVLTLLATDAFWQYGNATGATLDETTGLLMITPDQYDNLQPLFFEIGGVPFVLTPNAQIWPRSLNTMVGGKSDAIYLIVNDIGTFSGAGLDFMNGYTFLERYYSVFDTTNGRVGFAMTEYTLAECN